MEVPLVSHKHVKNTIYRKRFKTKDKNEVYMYKQQASKGGEAIIVSEIIRTIMIWLGDRESHFDQGRWVWHQTI